MFSRVLPVASFVVVELKSFDDLVLYAVSRLSTVSPSTSVFCSDENCFAVLTMSEQHFMVLKAPPPSSSDCRYAYVDNDGSVRCRRAPLAGKPLVVIVRARGVGEYGKLLEALSPSQ